MNTGSGLDLHALRGIAARRRGAQTHQHLLDRIAEHLDEHDGFVSWSGGKDSTVVVDLARQVDPHVPVVFFDSGLQFPETLRYLEDLAQAWRLNYHVITADPDLLTLLVAGGGFDHHAVDRRLSGQLADIMITGPAREAHSRYGRGSLWGVRAQESHGRRMLYRRGLSAETRARQHSSREDVRSQVGGVVQRADGTITYGPIWDWQPAQVFEYLAGRASSPIRCTASWPSSESPNSRFVSTRSSTPPSCPTDTSPGCRKAGQTSTTASAMPYRGFPNGPETAPK
ncbi:phosphoadenosine phosphosulfate reductase family protein [Mycobacterium kansasii]|uniref:Phosphoadenosine phosphosulfate reductase family protein n=1 Tax=Mycobacterium kansasii TaxID=1768 RepID=A0A1V3WE99_MYCKA|nr:phosphoadenosine phosphosulfate reductase family protein [Mycobacterium kansasii]